MRDILARIQIYIMLWLAMLVVSAWGLALISSPVSSTDNTPMRVTIPAGANAHEVALRLSRANLIRNHRAFVLTVGIRGEGGSLKPGLYELRRSMSLVQIIGKLVRGDVAAEWLTVPEGYTVRQIAGLLSAKGIADEQEFMQTALHEAGRFRDILPIPSSSVEGYLFPDTYLFSSGYGSDNVIREMLVTFRKKVTQPLQGEISAFTMPAEANDTASLESNQYRVITLASLIEREARTGEDRPLISSVLRNRLLKNMPLQIDATVQYALGDHRARLFYRDYATPSDYNTYLHRGLPPGPIASPGLESIKAALDPADSDYLYYVATSDGSHEFTRTLQEHNRAVAAARRARNRSEVP